MKYKEEELKKLHDVLYTILAEVIRVCNICNIPYFIQGGSAIGAFYNKGIVPWDDDIDVGMTRQNYIRFLEQAPTYLSKEYFLESFETEPNTPFYFAKVKLNNTLFVEQIWKDMDIHHGIFVDIFPYDRIPNNKFLEKVHRFISGYWINCFIGKQIWVWGKCGRCAIETALPKSWLGCFSIRIATTLLSRKSIYKIMNWTLGLFNSCNTKRVNIVRMPKDQIDRADIENCVKVPFGNLENVCLPNNVEKYLRHHYPNLRPVLPEAEQINHAPYILNFVSNKRETI